MFRNACSLRATHRVAIVLVALGVGAAATPTDADAQIAPSVLARSDPCPPGDGSVRARFMVAPYGWMAGISGETGVRDLSADVDVSFSELLSHLRFAAMGAFEAEYGPWLGAVDGVYTALRGNRVRSIGPGQAELTATMKMLVAQAFVGYSFSPAPNVAIDVLGGGRVWSIDASLKRSGLIDTATRSRSPTWGDALGGLRLRWAAERWQVSAAGDAGGGGSKGTGGGTATVGYVLATRWSVFGAYRYLRVNYRKDDFFFQGHLDGPVIGGAYRW